MKAGTKLAPKSAAHAIHVANAAQRKQRIAKGATCLEIPAADPSALAFSKLGLEQS